MRIDVRLEWERLCQRVAVCLIDVAQSVIRICGSIQLHDDLLNDVVFKDEEMNLNSLWECYCTQMGDLRESIVLTYLVQIKELLKWKECACK